jgi:hypothetical protein
MSGRPSSGTTPPTIGGCLAGYRPHRRASKANFRIQGLPPGNYLAVALPSVQGTEWQDPEFLQQYLGVATRVSLAEGETKTVSLKLIRR